MDSTAQTGASQSTAGQDPRLQPTPDYGSLGPSSDIHSGKPVHPQLGRLRVAASILAGILCALPFVAHGTTEAAWQQVSEYLTLQGKPQPASPAILSQHEIERLDRQSAQKQAELLLERAINHYDGANEQIAARVDHWRVSHLKLTPHLTSLITAALNSNDLRVRAAAIEIDLAAMNVAKVPSNVDVFAKEAESSDQSVRNCALWTLGLLGNRGVDPERVTHILKTHLHDSSAESRHWAVESLALVGTDETVEPLLRVFQDDPSPLVRERAACSLAQSGMLNEQQRRSAIPELLNFTDDPVLDAQTHQWVFQALRDITGQNLPDEAAAWRNWYSATGS